MKTIQILENKFEEVKAALRNRMETVTSEEARQELEEYLEYFETDKQVTIEFMETFESVMKEEWLIQKAVDTFTTSADRILKLTLEIVEMIEEEEKEGK